MVGAGAALVALERVLDGANRVVMTWSCAGIAPQPAMLAAALNSGIVNASLGFPGPGRVAE